MREATTTYEKYTVELAKASDYLLRKYGKSIAGRQHALKRVADMTIDLFVGLCVLSRATSLATEGGLSAEPGEEGAQAMVIAHAFARQARRRLAHNVRRIERLWIGVGYLGLTEVNSKRLGEGRPRPLFGVY